MRVYNQVLKPVADVLSAILFLTIFSPIIILTAIILFIANEGNVFFFQQRPGLGSRLFTIIKFKTMRDAFDLNGNPLPDEVRLTRVGKFVRSASLDELLQLVNVIKGEMSIVGPRPLLVQYLARYNNDQARRHEVKPGITGWAQVNGRNDISWTKKFELDLWYVENCSFLLDLKILFLTVLKVFKREGISQAGQASVENFKGNI